jgi:CubicO group peptidase (beta-lactamase class C family)
MKEEWRNITVREILSHSAGFMRDPDLVLKTSAPADQRKEVVSWALMQAPVKQEGTYLYSNLGYIIAGAIEEKLTGMAYEELLVKRVLEPLGIKSGGFGPTGTPGLEDEPLQHTNSHASIEPTADADNHPVYSPAGRLHMTIGDWAKYIRWVLSAEAGHQTFLKMETANILTTGIVPDGYGGFYAMGWGISNQSLSGGKTLTHAGSNGVNYSVAWLAPIKHFGVIAATNQGPGTSANPLNIVATRFIHFYLNGQ